MDFHPSTASSDVHAMGQVSPVRKLWFSVGTVGTTFARVYAVRKGVNQRKTWYLSILSKICFLVKDVMDREEEIRRCKNLLAEEKKKLGVERKEKFSSGLR
jgi:hypothetical protein